MASPRDALFSLQSKLIVAFLLVVLAALALAASVFVFVRRGEQEDQALEHVFAASPAIYTEFSLLQRLDVGEGTLAEFIGEAAKERDVRILLVERPGGIVIADSDSSLTDASLTVPDALTVVPGTGPAPRRPYVSWRPAEGEPAAGLVLVSPPPPPERPFGGPGGSPAEPYWLVLAVPEETITRAWLDLLPGLGVAAAIALPGAVIMAVVVAQYITRPLHKLTEATQRLAAGSFDVEVSMDRRDEVGQLARAFTSMAQRVGEAHRQVRSLVANVSHDLKTPLTSILGFSQELRDGRAANNGEARRLGGVIHEEAERLNARLRDILYLSELEWGEAVLEKAGVDLSRLVRVVAERFEADAAARGVGLELDVSEGITVAGDAAKLERALENLLDNACRYAAGDAVTVRAYVDEGASRALVEVSNAAPDLAEEELPRLFERFYRHDRTRGREARSAGSGLGLPIARDLFELHGGVLGAELRGGRVVFRGSLPL